MWIVTNGGVGFVKDLDLAAGVGSVMLRAWLCSSLRMMEVARCSLEEKQ